MYGGVMVVRTLKLLVNEAILNLMTLLLLRVRCRFNQTSRGFAFLVFKHPEAAAALCSSQTMHKIDGRQVEVKKAKPLDVTAR